MTVVTWSEVFGPGVVIIDGGLSTQLTRLGEDISGSLWTGRALLQDPAAVTRAHSAFVDAGADVIITASYQVSRKGFVDAGYTDEDADAALAASVAVARAAAIRSDRSIRVAASVGPYGAALHDGSEYRGNYGLSHRELVDFHRARLDVLREAEPDLLAIETIPDVREADALADALAGNDIPAWITFSAKDDGHTCAGQAIEEAAIVAAQVDGVVATGINCTDPRFVATLLSRMSASVELPLIAYPNAGGDWDPEDGEWHGGAQTDQSQVFDPDTLAAWRAAGAVAIGGCCGTDAAAIRWIAAALAAPAG